MDMKNINNGGYNLLLALLFYLLDQSVIVSRLRKRSLLASKHDFAIDEIVSPLDDES